MIHAQGIAKQFGPQVLFEGLHWQIQPRRRYGLVGPNGAGKTTLLRILYGELQPDAGNVMRPRGVKLGYLPQEVESLGEGSVIDAVLGGVPGYAQARETMHALHERMAHDHDFAATQQAMDQLDKNATNFERLGGDDLEVRARAALGGLGFARAAIEGPADALSGGWRMRGCW
jgi:ATP-binding cassette subfamily F protein 3